MSESAQVTAPGAITSMIVAMSTRPNRKNRSTCSRMSVPLVQKQKLGAVNRWQARLSKIAVRHDQEGRHRKNYPEDRRERPEDRREPSWFWFRCHEPPPGAPDLMSSDFRGRSGEMCELLHTSPVVQKMMGYPKSKSVTAITSSEAGSVARC